MNQPLKLFFEALNAQERKFLPALKDDQMGIFPRTAVSELDWFHYNVARNQEQMEAQNEQYYLFRSGMLRLLQLSLEARPGYDGPTYSFPRQLGITNPVLYMIGALGVIEHGRRLAQSVTSGVCRIECRSSNSFLIKVPSAVLDEEYYEKAILAQYQDLARGNFSQYLGSRYGQELNEEIRRKLRELVYPYAKHFIGYDTAPILDEYFYGIAYHEITLSEGYDTFHYSTRFGGIQFQKYKLALAFVLSTVIKHEKFAEALVEKDSAIMLENVLTPCLETDVFVESIKDALDYFGTAFKGFEETTLEEARRIFDVLSCSTKNTALIARPGAPLPFLIQTSRNQFVRCIAAKYGNPIQFLLDSLRHHFPKDYDRHQQSREKTMQLAIRRVLDSQLTALDYRDNVKVKVDGRIATDIDLAIAEESTGTIILCQLKHQDLYGSDLHSKYVRTSRLREETSRWLAAVDDWIGRVGNDGLLATLRLPKRFGLLHVVKLTLSKHYSYPLRDIALSTGSIHSNWAQFVNAVYLIKQQEPASRTLRDLMLYIKKENTVPPQDFPTEPQSDWSVGDLKFTVEHEKPK